MQVLQLLDPTTEIHLMYIHNLNIPVILLV
jgi:hypothetical protein